MSVLQEKLLTLPLINVSLTVRVEKNGITLQALVNALLLNQNGVALNVSLAQAEKSITLSLTHVSLIHVLEDILEKDGTLILALVNAKVIDLIGMVLFVYSPAMEEKLGTQLLKTVNVLLINLAGVALNVSLA